jgi:hypothetical protein
MKKCRIILIAICLGILTSCSDPQPRLLWSGILERVEYRQGGAFTSAVTVIYFQDGSQYTFYKIVPGLLIRGATLEIWEVPIGMGSWITEVRLPGNVKIAD